MDVQSVGGTSQDEVYSMATDSVGNVYVTGYFGSNIDFGTTTLSSAGEHNIYVAKRNPDGDWLWARKVEGTAYSLGYGIAIDSNDNCYITGEFLSHALFGSISLSGSGNMNSFVAKMDCNGNWLWARQAEVSSGNNGNSIAVDADANIYIAGTFSNIAEFGTFILNTSDNDVNTFVVKLDSNGNWLWARQSVVTDYAIALGLALDSNSNIYLSGFFLGTSCFGEYALTSDSADMFVTKLDSNGNWLWARKAESAGAEGNIIAYSIAVDTMSNIYTAGSFQGTVSMGNDTLISTNHSDDIFVSKLDTNGNWLWARQAGGQNHDQAIDIDIRSDNILYVLGSFDGSATFGNRTLDGFGSMDIFIARMLTSGQWSTVNAAGGVGNDRGQCIVTCPVSEILASGSFTGSASFDGNTIISNGNSDIFIAEVHIATPVNDDLEVPMPPFTIVNNYPNPFRGTTKIVVAIEDNKDVYELAIYDTRGRKIKNIHHGTLPKGESSFTWMAEDELSRNLPSGVYIYKLSNGATSQTKKMVLVK